MSTSDTQEVAVSNENDNVTKTNSEANSSNDWSEREIGALWRKGADRPFYSGTIRIGEEKFEIVIFPNKYKEKDNHPDLRIYKSKPSTQALV